MIPFTFRRVLKYTFVALSIFALLGSLRFANNQTRFQAFLQRQYITWKDFPTSYADALKAKDWDTLLQTYDYKKNFPTVEYNHDDATATRNIPPIIHFIWFRNLYETKAEITSIPSKGSEAPEHCRRYNPDYTINIWNASAARDLLEQHYAWFLPTYDAYRYPIQRVDAVKYFLLWHYGGIYMDMDIACRRSMDPLLPFPAWFPEASPLGVNNDLMATRSRHPVIRLMLENLHARNLNLIFPYLTIFWSTGPQFTGDLLKRWFLQFGGKYVPGESKVDADPSEWFVLPQEFYSEEFTFFGHSPGGTWHEDDVAVVLWFVAHPVIFWFLVFTVLTGLTMFIIRLRRSSNNPRSKDTGLGIRGI